MYLLYENADQIAHMMDILNLHSRSVIGTPHRRCFDIPDNSPVRLWLVVS